MRLTLATGVLAMLGIVGCSNGSRSADPSAYYYEWRRDFSTWVVYTVSTPEAVKAVHEWTVAHAVELNRVEEVEHGDWMPEDFLFEVYADGSHRRRALLIEIPMGWNEADGLDKPKGRLKLKWVPNLSAIDIDKLRKIFQEQGERVNQLPEDWW